MRVDDETVPEMIDLAHKGFDEFAHLHICHDGKRYRFRLNRRQIMQLAAGAYVAMADMEPGPWRRAAMEAA